MQYIPFFSVFRVVRIQCQLFKLTLILVLVSIISSCATYGLSRQNLSLIKPDRGNISYVYLLADSWSPISSNKYNIVINSNNIATINSNDVIPLKLQKGVYDIGINNGSDASNIKLDVSEDYFFLRISSEPGWEQSPIQFFPKPKISRVSSISMGEKLIQSKYVRSMIDITNTTESLEKSNTTKFVSKKDKKSTILVNEKKLKGKYHALLIGNNNYHSLPNLKSAINDVKSFGGLLREKFGFQITVLSDATRKDIIENLVKYRHILTRDDNFLLFYAGHGWLDSDADEGYWLPVNATKNSEANWVSNSTITSQIKAFDANHVMVISDSCYSGKLTRGISLIIKETSNRQKLIHRMREKKARTVMTSGGLEPVLDSGLNPNQSIFMHALLSTLKEGDDFILGNELFIDVRRKVIVNADQSPEYSDIRKVGHDGGDFIFVRK